MNTVSQIEFTGERMIPEVNRGMTLYYEHLLRYMMATNFVKGKKVMDVGCGVGYGSWLLKNAGASKVLGIDISKEAIEYAARKYKEKNIEFETGDGENLENYNRSFDVVTAFEFIEHIHNQENFLKGVKNSLKKDGLFFVSSPNKNTYQNHNDFHVSELTPETFENILKKYFTNVIILDQRFLFTNYIIPTHNKNENILAKLDEFLVKEQIESLLPLNSIKDSRYMIAVCSDKNINLEKKYFSISTYDVDGFSLKDGVEGLYKQWDNQIKISVKEKELLMQITNSRFLYYGKLTAQLED